MVTQLKLLEKWKCNYKHPNELWIHSNSYSLASKTVISNLSLWIIQLWKILCAVIDSNCVLIWDFFDNFEVSVTRLGGFWGAKRPKPTESFYSYPRAISKFGHQEPSRWAHTKISKAELFTNSDLICRFYSHVNTNLNEIKVRWDA